MNSPTRSTYLRIQTRAKVAERETQLDALEAKIGELRADFAAEGQKKVVALRLFMESRHSQILVIQEQMTDHSNAFATERQEAEAVLPGIAIANLMYCRKYPCSLRRTERWCLFADARAIMAMRAVNCPGSSGLNHGHSVSFSRNNQYEDSL